MAVKRSILDEAREANRLLEDARWEVIGDRLRMARVRQGFSVRGLAEEAVVSKTSVVRLEKGISCSPNTVVKICAALGLHLATLVGDANRTTGTFAVHQQRDDRWYDLTDFGSGPLGGVDRPITLAQRRKFVRQGVKTPLNVLRSRLPGGKLLSTEIEVYGRSETRSHAGEEFVYVISGKASIWISDVEHVLREGESIAFRSAEPHAYAPGPGVSEKMLPVRLLSVRMDDRPE